jgi:hypothetical protein
MLALKSTDEIEETNQCQSHIQARAEKKIYCSNGSRKCFWLLPLLSLPHWY